MGIKNIFFRKAKVEKIDGGKYGGKSIFLWNPLHWSGGLGCPECVFANEQC